MIFNEQEVIKVLTKIRYLCGRDLDNIENQTLETLIAYLDSNEPKLTYDEFKALFKCRAKYLDDEHVEMEITPKHKCEMFVDKNYNFPKLTGKEIGISISPEIEESLILLAYEFFMKKVRELKEELK